MFSFTVILIDVAKIKVKRNIVINNLFQDD